MNTAEILAALTDRLTRVGGGVVMVSLIDGHWNATLVTENNDDSRTQSVRDLPGPDEALAELGRKVGVVGW